MGITKTRDGRYLVGQGVTDGNEYKGSLAWRDIVIQLSADGATAESLEKLEFLRDYGLFHSGEGNSVMPPGVSVWISNNGTTTAVEADDITIDGSNYTICGIKWDGSAWDFSQAGHGTGGLPEVTSEDNGDVLSVVNGAWGKAAPADELPPVTAEDNGDVLSVVDGAWAKSPAPSSLPSYTSADKGKVLTVGEGSGSETVVVVPEQTVTTVQGESYAYALIENCTIDWNHATIGDSIELSINGTPYTANYDDGKFSKPAFIALNGATPVGAVAQTGVGEIINTFLTLAPGEYTISATAETPVAEAKWETVNQSLIYYETSGYNFKGLTVSEAARMLNNGKIPFVYVDSGIRMLTRLEETSSGVYSVYYNFSNSETASNVLADGLLPYRTIH